MKLSEIFNKTSNAINFISQYKGKIVNYRLYDIINNKSYIGTAVDLNSRLYNAKFGHVGSLYKNVRHDYIHIKILEVGLENFEIFIEKSDFQTVKEAELNEAILIEKYDSFLNGYNLTSNGKGGYVGTIQMIDPINNTTIRIKPNELDNYLLKGYKKGSNRKVVTDPITNRFYRVSVEEADMLVKNKGWIYGSKSLSTTKGFRSITNKLTRESKKVPKDKVNTYIANGWELGFGPNKERIYVTNLKTGESKKIDTKELNNYLNNGWYQGFGSNKGRKRIYKDNERKSIRPEDLDKYLSNGWKLVSNKK